MRLLHDGLLLDDGSDAHSVLVACAQVAQLGNAAALRVQLHLDVVLGEMLELKFPVCEGKQNMKTTNKTESGKIGGGGGIIIQ